MIHFRHTPGDCPRKAVTVNMLEIEDSEHFDEEVSDDSMVIGKIDANATLTENHLNKKIQILKNNIPFKDASDDLKDQKNILVDAVIDQNPSVHPCPKNVTISDCDLFQQNVKRLLMVVVKNLGVD